VRKRKRVPKWLAEALRDGEEQPLAAVLIYENGVEVASNVTLESLKQALELTVKRLDHPGPELPPPEAWVPARIHR
jgi:hypothetical protein